MPDTYILLIIIFTFQIPDIADMQTVVHTIDE